jgi:hypothetical protein
MDDPRAPVTADDLIAAMAGAVAAFEAMVDRDWSRPARDLDWSCADTLTHIHQAMWFYAGQTATAGEARQPRMLPASPTGIETAIAALPTSVAILLACVERLGADRVGWHGSGMADAEGFLAMGCDEIIVHTFDITEALGGGHAPDPAIAARLVARLFPWAPDHDDAAETLLWCNGRIALPGHDRLDDDWDWQCAPLDQWSGERNTQSNRSTR